MTIDRRALLGGMTGAAMLAPYLALERAMAREAAQATGNPSIAEQEEMADRHDTMMQDLLGDNLFKQEQVAMLLFPNFTALDLVGPHYFFACMFGATVHLVTTGPDLSPVPSDLGLAIAPTATLADVPVDLDVFFTPGGTSGVLDVMRDPRTMDWVRDRASRARYVTSVCTGSMILAKAGLLKGRRATSHWASRPVLEAFGAIPVEARVVQDGNILTGAGVSAGLDFAIRLVELVRGRTYAEALVLQAEYAPEPPIEAGSLATASIGVADMYKMMFAPFQAELRALAAS